MIKVSTALFIFISFNANASLQSQVDYQHALKDYIVESQDYIVTMSDSFEEMKSARNLVIQQKFDKQYSRLEKDLAKSNAEIATEIESYLIKNPKVKLDDTLLIRLAQLHFDRNELQKSIKYCDLLMKNYPYSPVVDKARYLKGYILEDLNQLDQAAKVYADFIQLQTYSQLLPEVRWRLGEYNFDTGLYSQAAENYQQLTNDKNHPLYWKAYYKWGASLAAAKKWPEARDVFVRLLEQLDAADLAAGEVQSLQDESYEYLALIESKGVLANMGEVKQGLVTEKMAMLYNKKNAEVKARETLEKYVRTHSDTVYLARFMNQIIASYQSQNLRDQAQEQRERLITFLSVHDEWWSGLKNQMQFYFEAEDILQQNWFDSAMWNRNKAYQIKSKPLAEKAKLQFENYLTRFGLGENALLVKSELAQLSYYLNDFPKASQYYRTVSDETINKTQASDSAYGYLLSEAKRIGISVESNAELKPSYEKNGTLSQQSALQENEKRLTEVIDFYQKKGGDGIRLQKALFKKAEILFSHNQWEKAIEVSDLIIQTGDSSILSLKANLLAAQVYNLQLNYKESQNRLNLNLTFLSKGVLESPSQEDLHYAGSPLELGYNLQNEEKWLSAAEEFEKVASLNNQPDNRDQALWEAAVLYRKVLHWKKSNELLKLLKSSQLYAMESSYLEACNLRDMMSFKEAAAAFEALTIKYPKSNLLDESLYESARQYYAMEMWGDAARNLEKVLSRNKWNAVYKQYLQALVLAKDSAKLQSIAQRMTGKEALANMVRSYVLLSFIYKDDLVGAQKICKINPQYKSDANLLQQCGSLNVLVQVDSKKTTSEEQLIPLWKSLSDKVSHDFFSIASIKFSEKMKKNSLIILQEAWAKDEQNLLDAFSAKLYPLLQSKSNFLIAHSSNLIPWQKTLANHLLWSSDPNLPELDGLVALCERGSYQECYNELQSQQTHYPHNKSLIKNILKASLLAEDQLSLSNWLEKWSEMDSRESQLIYLSWITYRYNNQKLQKKIPDAMNESDFPYYWAAVAESQFLAKKYSESIDSLAQSIRQDPESAFGYSQMSQKFYIFNKYQLAHQVAVSSYKNNDNKIDSATLYASLAVLLARRPSASLNLKVGGTEYQEMYLNAFLQATSVGSKVNLKEFTKTLDKNDKEQIDLLQNSFQQLNQSTKENQILNTKSSSSYNQLLSQIPSLKLDTKKEISMKNLLILQLDLAPIKQWKLLHLSSTEGGE